MAHAQVTRLVPQGIPAHASTDVYAFGPIRIDVARHSVTRDGRPLALAPKTFELLLILVRSGGRVLSRQELVAALWPDTFVEEANLSFQISTLRRALGYTSPGAATEAGQAEHWIETIPKLGYRFTPEATSAPTVGQASPMSPRSRASKVLLAGGTVAVALSLTVLFVSQYARWRAPAGEGPTPAIRSIAVLPFEDLSPGQGDAHYADGLTEALIAELSILDRFDKVTGRQAVSRFRASSVPPRDAARALGVDAIVTASLLRSAGRLRVTARLVDGATERHLWAATYERPDGEVLLVQRQIVEAIAGAVHLALIPDAVARMPEPARLAPRPSTPTSRHGRP